MKVLEFNANITKIMTNSRIPDEHNENHENHRIQYENFEKNENYKMKRENH